MFGHEHSVHSDRVCCDQHIVCPNELAPALKISSKLAVVPVRITIERKHSQAGKGLIYSLRQRCRSLLCHAKT